MQEEEQPCCESGRLLDVQYSGVYFTARDFMTIAREMGYDYEMAGRETLLRNLFVDSQLQNRLHELLPKIAEAYQSRLHECHRLEEQYPDAGALVAAWKEKADTLFAQMKQKMESMS